MCGPFRDIGAWQSRQSLSVGLRPLRVILGAMNIVATEACDSASVHHALHEIISLHAVLMSSSVREVREGGLAKFVFFKLPKIA